MDRSKRRWFILLALVLGGAVLLLGRGLMHRTADDTAGVHLTQTRPESPRPAAAIPESQPTPSSPDAERSVLRGRVIDAVTRRAVRQFEIRLQRLNTPDEESPIARSFQSDNGTFVWDNAPVGNWYVTVTAPDYQRFEIEELSIAAQPQTRELTVPLLRGYKVTGRVFDEGSGVGIADASVGYRESSADVGAARSGYVASNKDGSFVFEGVPRGRITLRANSQEHAARELEIVVSEQTPRVAIGLVTGGTISGFLLTASGAPTAGPVALANEQRFSNIKKASEDGAFSFEHLPAGRYRLGAGGAWQEVTLARDERREGIILQARAQSRVVRGTVTGLRRDELEHAFVILNAPGTHAMRPLDPRGEFVLNGVPPGRADLRVETGSRMLRKSIEVPADKDLVVDVEFAAGVHLSGRVTQGDKPVAAGVKIWMDPLPRAQGLSYHGRTAADGTYRIEGVAAGEYDVRTAANASRRIRISDEDAVLDLEMPAVQLAGRVIEDGGTAPVVDAHVYATQIGSDSSRVRPNGASDHFGQFNLTGLESGEIVLSAYKRGYELFRQRIDYSSPVTDLTIKMRPGSGVEINAHLAGSGVALRELTVSEQIAGGGLGIIVSMQLDADGSGSLPRGLAGSTLTISGAGREIVVREWDGQPLDLKLR